MIESSKKEIAKIDISLKEICYYLFFGLLSAAKGLGLYDGQGIFKVILIAALGFWVANMLLSDYQVKEIVLIGILLMLGIMSYVKSGDKAAIIAVMVLTGMKNIPVKRLFGLGLFIWALTFFVSVSTALLGIKSTVRLVHNKGILGFVIRDSLGLTHPNVLHITYLILISLLFVVMHQSGKSLHKAVLASFLGSILIFLYSLSYTGFMFVLFYLFLVEYLNVGKANVVRERTKAEEILLQLVIPFLAFFSLAGPVLLKGRVFDIVNKLVNTRFALSRFYLTSVKPGLFGTNVPLEGNNTIDSSYVHLLYYYGIVPFVLMIAGMMALVHYLIREKRNHELAMVLGLAAAGFTEPFLFNFSFKNLILPLLGELFFVFLSRDWKIAVCNKSILVFKGLSEKTIPCRQLFGNQSFVEGKTFLMSKKRLFLAGVALGLVIGVIAGCMVTVPSYVIVNKKNSDRIGKKGDYLIYSEIDQNIKDDSLRISIQDDDTKVYVLSGKIMEYQLFRKRITILVLCVTMIPISEMLVLYVVQRIGKKSENLTNVEDIDAG